MGRSVSGMFRRWLELDVCGMLLVYLGVEIMLTQAQMGRNALQALSYNLLQ
jgi:hypothetical protein